MDDRSNGGSLLFAKVKKLFLGILGARASAAEKPSFPNDYLGTVFPFEDDLVSVYTKGRTGDLRRYHWGFGPTCVFKCVKGGWQLIAIEHREVKSPQ